MKTNLLLAAALALVSSVILHPLSLLAQGSLIPPGAPAPLFKTLNQVEPRIPLTSAFVGGDLNSHFIITNSGAYYLTSNVNVTLAGAVRVVASNVTLDLGGFSIQRVSGGAGTAGITIEGTADGLVVKDGFIRGIASGTSASSVGGRYARGGRFERLHVEAFTSLGLNGGEGWLVEDCTVTDGLSATGLSCIGLNGPGGVISRCAVRGNSTSAFQIQAILTSLGAVVRDCTVTSNNAATTFTGILIGGGSVASHCVVKDNVAATANVTGFSSGSLSLLSHCVASGNRGTTNVTGISANNPTTIENCVVTDNTASGAGFCRGVHVSLGTPGNGSIIRDTIASANRNTGTGECTGIHASIQASVLNCQADNNVSIGGSSTGIFHVGHGLIQSSSASQNTAALTNTGIHMTQFGSVLDCTANSNAGTNAVPASLGGVGIRAGQGVLVARCSAAFNRGDGIRLDDGNILQHSSARSNGSLGDGAGIHATSFGNRIEGNHAYSNDRGIQVVGTGNFIARNTAAANSTNFVIAANNVAGPFVSGTLTSNIVGNAGGAGFGSTDPAANVSH